MLARLAPIFITFGGPQGHGALPYGRGSATVALISQGLPSRDRQGAVFVSQESPKWLSTHACGHVPQVECAAPFNAALLKYLGVE